MNVIVVGAGIAGLSTAWSLVKAGHRSRCSSRADPQPARRLRRPSPHHPPRLSAPPTGYGRLITEAYEAWDELWADLGESHLDPRGFLCISREAGDEAEQYRDGLEAGGYPFEMFDAGRPRRAGRSSSRARSATPIFSPEGGALHCRKIAAGWPTGCATTAPMSTRTARSWRSMPTGRDRARMRRDDAGRPDRRRRRRLGAEAVSANSAATEDLPDRARLCRAAGRPEGSMGGRAGHPRCRRQDRRLHRSRRPAAPA